MKKYLLFLASLAVILTLSLSGCGGGGGGGGGGDSDGDGIPNNQDAFPNDPTKFASFTQVNLPGLQGVTFSSAMSINDAGMIVGASNDLSGDIHGVIWPSSTAEPIRLEFPPHPGGEFGAIFGTNNHADAVGESNNAAGGRDAIFFLGNEVSPQNASAVVLTPEVGALFQAAYDINNARVIVGEAQSATTGTKAVAWTLTVAAGVATSNPPTPLGEPAGATSSAYAISEDNRIVGEYTLNGVTHGSLWTLGATLVPSTLIDLPPLAGDTESVAYGINGAGQIVGESTSALGVTRGVTWTVAAGVATPVNLSTGSEGNALAINDAGRLAGWTAPTGGTANASIWDVRNLDLADKFLAATTFSQGFGINATGSIVGMGGTTGNTAFVAVPQ